MNKLVDKEDFFFFFNLPSCDCLLTDQIIKIPRAIP